MLRDVLINLLDDEEQERIENNERFRVLNLQRRVLRDVSNPFSMPRHYFIKHYRMDQNTILKLIDLLENDLLGERSTCIPVHLQVLITLRFMAEGSLQKGLCREFLRPVGQSTASKVICRVQNSILRLHNLFIQFPTTPEARNRIQNDFQRTIRIPGVIGVVDCFLVTFKRPSENEEAFFNYRVGCSMNVQIIVDSNYNILNIRVCPGSKNDRFVWQYSQAKDYLEYLRADANIVQQESHFYILADNGYTPSPTVLTPDLNALPGSPASMYTNEHVGMRRYVEQTIGLLTNVWRAIKRCRKLNYAPDSVARIINVASILHNFRRRYGNHNFVNQPIIINGNFPRENRDFPAGIAERNCLIERHYR